MAPASANSVGMHRLRQTQHMSDATKKTNNNTQNEAGPMAPASANSVGIHRLRQTQNMSVRNKQNRHQLRKTKRGPWRQRQRTLWGYTGYVRHKTLSDATEKQTTIRKTKRGPWRQHQRNLWGYTGYVRHKTCLTQQQTNNNTQNEAGPMAPASANSVGIHRLRQTQHMSDATKKQTRIRETKRGPWRHHQRTLWGYTGYVRHKTCLTQQKNKQQYAKRSGAHGASISEFCGDTPVTSDTKYA